MTDNTEPAIDERVRVPDHETGDELEAKLVGFAAPDEAIEIPLEHDTTRMTDAAWIQFDDGTTKKVVRYRMRRA